MRLDQDPKINRVSFHLFILVVFSIPVRRKLTV
jgi:hypothetical protein